MPFQDIPKYSSTFQAYAHPALDSASLKIIPRTITVTYPGLKLRVHNEKLIFLFLNQNICCGYSKELSQWEGSFEHPKHMLKLMGKKIFTILLLKILFI